MVQQGGVLWPTSVDGEDGSHPCWAGVTSLCMTMYVVWQLASRLSWMRAALIADCFPYVAGAREGGISLKQSQHMATVGFVVGAVLQLGARVLRVGSRVATNAVLQVLQSMQGEGGAHYDVGVPFWWHKLRVHVFTQVVQVPAPGPGGKMQTLPPDSSTTVLLVCSSPVPLSAQVQSYAG